MEPQQPYGNPEQQPQYAPPPPQQPYGAPQPGYAPPPPGYSGQAVYASAPAASNSKWGPTSVGLEAHIAAGLSYITIVGLIFFFIEKNNRFVRFHAAQSILLGATAIVLSIVDFALNIVLSIIGSAGNGAGLLTGGIGLLFLCVFSLAFLGLFALDIWGLIAGFTGRYVKFPIIGNIAEQWAGGPATPAVP